MKKEVVVFIKMGCYDKNFYVVQQFPMGTDSVKIEADQNFPYDYEKGKGLSIEEKFEMAKKILKEEYPQARIMSEEEASEWAERQLKISHANDIVKTEEVRSLYNHEVAVFEKQGCLISDLVNENLSWLNNVDLSAYAKISVGSRAVVFERKDGQKFELLNKKLNSRRNGKFAGKRRINFCDDPKHYFDAVERLRTRRARRLEEFPTPEELEFYMNRNSSYVGQFSVNIRVEKSLIAKALRGKIIYIPINQRGRVGLYYTNHDKLPAPSNFRRAIVNDKIFIESHLNGKFSVREVKSEDFEEFTFAAAKASWLTSAE